MKIQHILPSLILCILFFGESPVKAITNLDYEHLEDEENFLSQTIYSIVKDEKGFVWIASRSGISRYDGRNLKHYTFTQTDIMQNHDGRAFHLRKSQEGELWAFTDNGKIYRYDADRDRFLLYIDLPTQYKVLYMFDLYPSTDGKLWIASIRGLLQVELTTNPTCQLIGSPEIAINTIQPLPNNQLALGTTKGVHLFDRQTNTFLTTNTFASDHNIMSIYYEEENQYLWLGSFSSGLFIWNLSQSQMVDLPGVRQIPAVPIKVIRKYTDGSLLVGLDGRGVYRIDPAEGKATLFLSNDDYPESILKANNVYDIMVDDLNIWVGTYTGGVTIVKGYGPFGWIKPNAHNARSVKGSHIYAIHEDRDGDYWYATNLGISFQDRKNNKWTHYLQQENSFLTITEDKNGLIWTGGYSTGLYTIDKQKGIVRYIPSLHENPQLDCIYASATDPDGDLWFGCLYTSLTRITTRNGKEERIHYPMVQVKSIEVISPDTLFIGTSSGFYLLDKQTGKSQHYFTRPWDNHQLESNSFIYSGLRIGDEIWFGTDGGGLNRFHLKTKEVINYSTYNGLPSNYIYGMLQDENGNLWVSTNMGIFCFDPVEGKFLFNVDNLPMKDFLFMSFARFRDGRLAFGGINGAVVFRPGEIPPTQLTANLFLTDFRLFYQTIKPEEQPDILPVAIDQMQEITLKHNQNSFSFSFVAIDLYQSGKYRYRYRLEGFNNTWIESSSSLTADYTNISPGKYTYVVQCLNRDSREVLAERRVGVRVQEPFWNTIWAWMIYYVLFFTLIYWIWTFYQERLRKKETREKINFFINISHDIRTPLSLVLSPLNNLEQETGLSEKGKDFLRLAKQNGEKLLALITLLLDFEKEDLSPSQNRISGCDLADYLQHKALQFATLARQKEITVRVEVPDEKAIIQTDTRKLDRIMDNLVSNAIKYSTPVNEVCLRLLKNGNEWRIEVEDHGIGIPKSGRKRIFKHVYRGENAINSKETGSGIGLMFTRKLANQINGRLTFTSEENKGTTFTLSLPVGKRITGTVQEEPALTTVEESVGDLTTPKRYFTESYRILLVEDNDDMRNYLASMLSEEYKAYSVPSAERALEFLKDNRVDLVISDIMMEGMQGDELCRLLKTNIETSHIHVILLTAVTQKEKMMNSLGYGADDYITKPFDIHILKKKIHNLLMTRKKLQQYYLTKNKLQEIDTQPEENVEPPVQVANLDEEFLQKCIRTVTDHLAEPEFSVNELCREMAMSRTLLYEKLKALTDQSPKEFVRVIRLRRSKELLEAGEYTVQEVADMTGFPDARYFSTVFKKYYGISPSKVAK